MATRSVVERISDEQREDTYYDASVQASRLGIQISRVFGSQQQSGVHGFGTRVPALLVHDSEGGKLVDVYPHSHKHDPVDTTILDYLESACPRRSKPRAT